MKKLIKGLHKFQTKVFPIRENFFQDLAKGQKPEVLFITCSDSRINPNLLTSSDPGELFIIRNAGNIIPHYVQGIECSSEQATIEFAIAKLKVKNIILCGHSHCGAIEAATQLNTLKDTPGLYNWIYTKILPTMDLVSQNYKTLNKSAFLNILTQEHVLKQLENLKTHPIVNEAIIQNSLSLHVWIYKFETGKIFSFDSNQGQFKLIEFNAS